MTNELFIPVKSLESTGLVKAGISQRNGGVSPPPYSSLNLATHVNDNLDNVTINQQRLSKQIGINTLKYCQQIHSDQVIDADQLTHTIWNGIGTEESTPTGDALISKINNTTLGVFTADCIPISILDLNTPSVAIVHAGWRGTEAHIVIKTLDKMKEHYGTKAHHCLIHLGPSIQKCCYEVGEDLLFKFSQKFGPSVVYGNHLCLQTANAKQLIDYSVPETSISISPYCTSCNINLFYSYRAEGQETGRMLSYIQLI